MINYTERLTLLMQDIVSRVPELSFIDMSRVLVFARTGRTNAEGDFATCHCLSLPPSEPGYYFWRERETGRITRRSEWFITKSPSVTIGARPITHLISFTLPRFCDQTLDWSRKERFHRRDEGGWVAKLDTVIHEMYHIDPSQNGIRRMERGDGTHSAHCHGKKFFEQVAAMVAEYLDSRPDPAAYDFLRLDFEGLQSRHHRVVGRCFRTFPSYPRRFIERLTPQPACSDDLAGAIVQPLSPGQQPTHYTEQDLHIRHFMRGTSRRLPPSDAFRAA